MIQRTIFDYLPGGGAHRKKSSGGVGLCRCQKPAVEGKTRCRDCAVKGAQKCADRRKKLIEEKTCTWCGKAPLAPGASNYCASCGLKIAQRMKRKREDAGRRWLDLVTSITRKIAKGLQKASKEIPWTTEDFACKFVEFSGDLKGLFIDHIIHKNCALDLGGAKDLEMARCVLDLPNIQILTKSQNDKKGRFVDPLVLARCNALRLEGLAGAALFKRLCDEFYEAATAHQEWPK